MYPTPTVMSSSLTSTMPALTTQFVQQGSCANIWTTTQNDGIPFLKSDSNDARFSGCQPSGWDGGSGNFSFSPAVCPSDWTWFEMTKANLQGSMASCCASGFTWGYTNHYGDGLTDLGIASPCFRSTAMTETGEDAEPTTLIVLQLHEAWHVSWQEKDTKTMTPKLPSLASTMLIPTWTPGQEVKSGMYQNPSESADDSPINGLKAVYYFIYIGVPLILIALIASCAWCCHGRGEQESKARRLYAEQQKKMAAVRNAEGRTPGVEEGAPVTAEVNNQASALGHEDSHVTTQVGSQNPEVNEEGVGTVEGQKSGLTN